MIRRLRRWLLERRTRRLAHRYARQGLNFPHLRAFMATQQDRKRLG